MRRAAITLAAVLALAAAPVAACPTGLTVIDGDTIAIDGEEIRLAGFDAPEVKHARCDAEREIGRRATQRLEELVCRAGPVTLDVVRRRVTPEPFADRYRRAVARVTVDGIGVADVMVAEGLARRSKPRRGWCHVLGTDVSTP